MSRYFPNGAAGNVGQANSGSVLIYVLWILVVISAIAFQLTSASRATTLNKSAFSHQLKKQMQIESAVQFAIFKIRAKQWHGHPFSFELNNQKIELSIFNESGFISIYQSGSKTLDKVFDFVNLDEAAIEAIRGDFQSGEKQKRFNSFLELGQIEGVDDEVLQQLIPLISVFHEESVNPMYAPGGVLMLVHGIDQYRVQKLIATEDEIERTQLRREVINILKSQGKKLSRNLNSYYRVNISLDGRLYRIFLKYDQNQDDYKVVLTNTNENILSAGKS